MSNEITSKILAHRRNTCKCCLSKRQLIIYAGPCDFFFYLNWQRWSSDAQANRHTNCQQFILCKALMSPIKTFYGGFLFHLASHKPHPILFTGIIRVNIRPHKRMKGSVKCSSIIFPPQQVTLVMSLGTASSNSGQEMCSYSLMQGSC